jgi:hypothetical protein
MSEYLRNNTPVFTAKGVEVVPYTDGCMTEGKLMLHDSCIDKPTGDNYTCTGESAVCHSLHAFSQDPQETPAGARSSSC